MVISLTAMDPRPSRALTRSVSAATADPQPSGPQRSGGWRAERSCCCARNGRSPGEEDREQAIAGARPGSAATASWREIRQSKARLDAWPPAARQGEHRLKRPHAAMRRHRTTSALRDAATHRPATRANEKRRPRPYWRQRRSAVGSDRGNITLVVRQPRSDRRRRPLLAFLSRPFADRPPWSGYRHARARARPFGYRALPAT